MRAASIEVGGLLAGGGEMGGRIRSHEWAQTPLGPIDGWPQPLKTTVGIMLRAASPMGIYWGAEHVLLYNDAWRDLVGDKHPGALGRPARAVFPEIWEEIGPRFADVLAGRGSVHVEDQLLPLDRSGRIEEAWFSFSCDAIPLEDGSVGGILNIGAETTERVLAERAQGETAAALRESEARARNIVESIADGLMTFDFDWRITFVNSRGAEIVGPLAGAAEDMLGRVFWDLFPDADETPFGATYRKAMDERVATTVEGYYPPLDGWFDARCYPLRDGLAIYFLDISARVRAEEQLRRSEALLDAVMSGVDALIYAKDRSGRFLMANARLERLAGVERGDLIGKTDMDVLEPGYAREIRKNDLAVMEYGETRWFEEKARSEDGSEHVYLSAKSPLHDGAGAIRGVVGVTSDITDQKRAEQALRASEARFRALVTATSNVVYRMSPDWAEMRELDGRGFIADAATPRRDWMDDYIDGEDQPEVLAAIREAMRTKSTFDLEHRVRRTDGSLGWVRSRAVPLLGDDGEIVEWFGAASDITGRKRAEEHQSMLMAELDHRVKNILAVVQSIVRQSLGRDGGAGASTADRLTGRLAALAQSHTLLADSRWEGARFGDLVENAVAPYRGERAARVHAAGPDLQVTPKAAQTLTLALHELVTNAAKYGALSGQAGRVDVAWELVGPGDGGRLVFRWAEHGGPPIEGPPSHKGFGSRLLERALSFELAGTVTLEYAQDGFKAVFDLPLETVGVDGRRHRRAANRASAP